MYARVREIDDVVVSQSGHPITGGVGPPAPAPEEPGYLYFPLTEPIDWTKRSSETSVLKWNGGDPGWEEVLTIEQLRAEKNQAINAWKLEANNTYFQFAGKQIAYGESDRVEIQAINNVVLLTGAMPVHPDWPAAWKTIDNAWVPLPDLEMWTAFNLAIAARGTEHFKRAQQLKGVLASATTVAEIEAITWEGNI